MADLIHFNSKGEAAFTIVKTPAWHQKGFVQFPESGFMTAKECIVGAHMDNVIEKAQLSATLANGQIIELPRYYMYNTENNAVFHQGAAVTDQYTIVQNVDAFKFFDNIVGEGKAIYTSAGMLLQGQIVFISAKLPDYIRINGKEEETIEKHLLLMSRHDGLGAIKAKFTNIQVVCNNTLQAALNDGNDSISFQHSTNVFENMKKASELLHLVNLKSEKAAEMYTNLSKVKLGEADITKLIAKTFLNDEQYIIEGQKVILTKELSTRSLNIISDVRDLIYFGVGQNQEARKETLYGFISGVSYYLQNIKQYNTAGIDNPQKKFLSQVQGSSNAILNKATQAALNYV